MACSGLSNSVLAHCFGPLSGTTMLQRGQSGFSDFNSILLLFAVAFSIVFSALMLLVSVCVDSIALWDLSSFRTPSKQTRSSDKHILQRFSW